jgi:hypothetical protein
MVMILEDYVAYIDNIYEGSRSSFFSSSIIYRVLLDEFMNRFYVKFKM